jgi:acetyl esterase
MTHPSLNDRLQGLALRFALGLPSFMIRQAAGRPLQREGRRLDPQLQLMLKLQRLSGDKPWQERALPQARRRLDVESGFMAPRGRQPVTVSNRQVDGPAAAIPVRVYRPQSADGPTPALVFYHGGGFVLGSLESHDAPCREIAAGARCTVIAVDYRLAPEHPFPAAMEDALAAFRSVAARAGDWGVDARRIAVGGDSAGGNLAAVVSQQTRADAVRPCFQWLIYPTVDFTMSFPSIETFGKGFLLERRTMDWFLANYLQQFEDKRDPRCSPLFGDLAGLPPACVQVAGFDPLCDEGSAYAQRLQQAGTPVQYGCYTGLVHGYFNMTGSVHAARRALDEGIASLRKGLGGT